MIFDEGLIYHTNLNPSFLELHEIIDWCDKQYGFNNWDWENDNQYGFCVFYFREEADMNWFLLRWS